MDSAILEMAIIGYQNELNKLSARIAEIRRQLVPHDGFGPKVAADTDHSGPRRKLSASARARIAAAQRARWAAYKGAKGAPQKTRPATAKRKLSAAGRRAIREANRKRWAKFHKARKTTA
jgi:hypothetical protein